VPTDNAALIQHLDRELQHGRFAAMAEQASHALDGLSPQDPAALEIRLLRANGWRRIGRQREAEADLAALRTDCASVGTAAATLDLRVWLEQAKLTFVLGEVEKAEGMAQGVADAALAAGARTVEGDAYFLLGLIGSMSRTAPQAQSYLERGLAIFEASDDEYRLAEGRSMLGMVLVNQGRNLEGIQLWRRALAYHESEGNAAAIATCLHRIGFAAWCEGDLEQTRRTLHRVLSLGDANPDAVAPHLRLMSEFNLASVELLDGRLEEAEQCLNRAERLALTVEDGTLLAATYTVRVSLALLRGRFGDAQTSRGLALRAMEEVNDPPEAPNRMLFALAQYAAGQREDALAAWPAELPVDPDGDERMALRGVLVVLQSLRSRLQDAQALEQLTTWQAALAPLLAT